MEADLTYFYSRPQEYPTVEGFVRKEGRKESNGEGIIHNFQKSLRHLLRLVDLANFNLEEKPFHVKR